MPNAVVAKGQSIDLPAGYNRVYVLAASTRGDQKTTFEVGAKKIELNIEDWGGFIGQWDDRQWGSKIRRMTIMAGWLASRAISNAPTWRGVRIIAEAG